MDYNSALPIRSKQDLDERTLVKIQSGDNPDGLDATALVTDKQVHTKIFQSDGMEISEQNPLPVAPTESAGNEVEDYNESVDVAPNVNANHDYVAQSDFKQLNVEASASGKARFELQVETAASSGTFETRGVKFNSTANPNVKFNVKNPRRVASGVTIRIVKTNLDEQAQSIYSTINGVEV